MQITGQRELTHDEYLYNSGHHSIPLINLKKTPYKTSIAKISQRGYN